MEIEKKHINEEEIIAERSKKFVNFIKTRPLWIFYVALLILIILGVYIRYLPLSDHNGRPGLWDITTNDYTLGPDLDPFLFLRYARTIIENGSLPKIDTMRNVPLGFDTTTELQMVSYMIVLTYKIINIFGEYGINYAGAFMPVWAFALTIIAFFLFVREIFIRKNNKETYVKANLISLIATLFMIIIPAFLSRTVAGIPEKESIAFLFMFLAFYLFLRAWKSEKIVFSSIWGILAGISTALMGLSWGGVGYVYTTMALAGLVAFILGKFDKKTIMAYGLWLLSAFIFTISFTNRFNPKEFFLGFDTGLACIVVFVSIAHVVLWNTQLYSKMRLDRLALPKTIISLLVVVILAIIASFFISPTYMLDRLIALNDLLIRPISGRWSTTVAENRQPYFTEWFGSFGKTIFWFIFIGSALLFNRILDKIKKKDALVLTGLYVLFFFGLVFSRYAAHPSLLDGENFISKLFYYGSALIFAAGIILYYISYQKEKDNSFENIDFEYVLLFALFVLTLFTARSAVRLIMVLIPIAPIFLSYMIVELGYMTKDSESKDKKFIWGIVFAVVLLISAYSAYNYYNSIKSEAYNYVPYYYTEQWQKAMFWVRENTSSDSVFAHWWDYGYWLQSIGERATVTDGGNAIVWWNYLTGRYVLTGDNQKDSLEFLYNHNATHLLIDSSDIGKYGAFSQIGSNKEYDRYSFGPVTMLQNEQQVQETANGTTMSYQGTGCMEEDLNYVEKGQQVFIPGITVNKNGQAQCNAYFIGAQLDITSRNNSESFVQPQVGVYYRNIVYKFPLRYLYYEDHLYDFKSGLNSTLYVIPRVTGAANGLKINKYGASIFLSPRVMRGFLGQVYILNDPLNNFPNFKLVHSQPGFFVEAFQQQTSLNEFTYFDSYAGLNGPIKIWSINYKGNEKINENYLLKTPPENIDWKF